jgi:hypothetical protein
MSLNNYDVRKLTDTWQTRNEKVADVHDVHNALRRLNAAKNLDVRGRLLQRRLQKEADNPTPRC